MIRYTRSLQDDHLQRWELIKVVSANSVGLCTLANSKDTSSLYLIGQVVQHFLIRVMVIIPDFHALPTPLSRAFTTAIAAVELMMILPAPLGGCYSLQIYEVDSEA